MGLVRTRARRRPTEYGGIAFCAAAYGAALGWLLYTTGAPANPVLGALKAVAAGLCALSWVTAEALWRARPWAYQAGLALAVGTVGVFAASALAAVVTGNLLAALGTVFGGGCVAFVVWPMLGYLRRTASQP